MKYVIISNENIIGLESAIRQLLNEKWAPLGSPFVRGTTFYQALTKEVRYASTDRLAKRTSGKGPGGSDATQFN